MTCRELVELLIDFTSGELPPEKCRIVEDHLRNCPPCVAFYESYRLIIKLVRLLPRSQLPPEKTQKLQAVLQGIYQNPPPATPPADA